MEQEGEHPLLEPQPRVLARAAVHEHVALARVPVDVAVDGHVAHRLGSAQQRLDRVDGGVEHAARVGPLPVQVLPVVRLCAAAAKKAGGAWQDT